MDYSKLAKLAKAVAGAGSPVLAEILGTVLPFPANLVAKTVLNGIGAALGVDPDDPDAMADKINDDPTAAQDALNQLEEEHKHEWEMAKLQVEQNQAEVATGNLFMGGWRPAFAWSVIVMVWYQCIEYAWGLHHPIPVETFAPIWAAFAGMLGLRTVEKWLGVDTAKVSIIPNALKRVFGKKK